MRLVLADLRNGETPSSAAALVLCGASLRVLQPATSRRRLSKVRRHAALRRHMLNRLRSSVYDGLRVGHDDRVHVRNRVVALGFGILTMLGATAAAANAKPAVSLTLPSAGNAGVPTAFSY